MKRTPLKRTAGLRRRPRVLPEDQAAREVWRSPVGGFCQCGCSPPLLAMHLERHHVIEKELIRRMGRFDLVWDLRNSMLVHPKHHSWHTSAFRRIALASVPGSAWEFAAELLGEDAARVRLERLYATDVREAA